MHKRKPSAKLSNIGSHTKKAVDIYQNAHNTELKKKYQGKRKETSRAKIEQTVTNDEQENRHFNFNDQVIQNMEQSIVGESIEFNRDYRQMISPNLK